MGIPTLKDASTLRDGRWYRFHPLSPVLRGGVIVIGFLGFAFFTLWETVVIRVVLSVLGVDEDQQPEVSGIADWVDSAGEIAVTTLVVSVVVGLALWLQWRSHMVRMDADVIEVKQGVLSRSSRKARRDRVNAIGIRRPLIPRLLGLSKLDIQAAGSDANVVLAYVPHALALELRREILEGAPPAEAETPTENVTRVVDVPLGRYFASLVVSVESVMFVISLAVAIVAAINSEELATWLGPVIVAFVYVSYLADRFFRVGSFVVDSVENEIRVSFGLLSTSVEAVPSPRIHALQVSQPWPWRLLGWWRIDANLASSPGSQDKKAPATSVICPVASTEEMLRLVGLCVPSLATQEGVDQVSRGLTQSNDEWKETSDQTAIVSPKPARIRLPLSVGVNRGWRVGETVVLRSGTWIRRLVIVPLVRVQSSSVSTGPLHRMFGLGLVSLHGVSGPITPVLLGLDYDEARQWWAMLNQWVVDAIGAKKKVRRSRVGVS